MTSIQPELWVDTPRAALTFYEPRSAQRSFNPPALVTPPGGVSGLAICRDETSGDG
jgi:hypothetical protein